MKKYICNWVRVYVQASRLMDIKSASLLISTHNKHYLTRMRIIKCRGKILFIFFFWRKLLCLESITASFNDYDSHLTLATARIYNNLLCFRGSVRLCFNSLCYFFCSSVFFFIIFKYRFIAGKYISIVLCLGLYYFTC